ncbi:hypothetical protein CR513_26211, partial [Mucuna pruriens]
MPNRLSSWNNSHMSLSTSKDRLILRHVLLVVLETKLLGFESLKDLYVGDDDLKEAYESCANSANGGFFKHEGFLFKEKKLCSWRHMKVALMGHFGERKTYKTLHEHFYWPHIRRDVYHVCGRCLVCKIAKSRASYNGLYSPLPIPISS